MNEKLQPGFTYTIEHIRDGIVIDREEVHNLMPTEGLNHLLGVALKSASQNANWYVGLFEGDYTPLATDTAAALPSAATECTAYTAATRVALTLGTVAAGAVDNSAAKSEFTSNDTKTVYGGFITSAAAKSATSGVLLSVARFASPKPFAIGDLVRVTVGFNFVSV